ncbi:MAG: uroporphyrinogen-III synthase [Cyanobium sp. NAT70]|nr:uroporphyrinogen-III synthase [Cyanobium sp. NAT70]|tara:strand:- start:2621 stop:3448 length:828 start_codon:yes stop_codon:yes gene_type:complete
MSSSLSNLSPNTSSLSHCTVVVTRAAEQQGEAKRLLEQQGAQVLDLPALEIGPPDQWGPLDDALSDLDNFHWLVFSSANGVQAVEQRLQRLGRCLARRPKTLKIAAVGRKTARVLKELGSGADFVPPEFVADSLIEHFPVSGWGLRMLLPRVQSGGRTVLADAFGEAGVRVVEVAAYESRCPASMPDQTAEALGNSDVDAITFSSGKTADHTALLLEQRFGPGWMQHLNQLKLISIGPQTSRSCKARFGRVDAEANPHDLEGLVAACLQAIQTAS